MADWTQIKYETSDSIATITLNRPEKKNALSALLIAELQSAFETAGQDDAMRVLVLRGAGSDFCAGADLAQLEALSTRTIIDNLDDAREYAHLVRTMRGLGKCIVAAVHGRAFAGGAGLSAACDLVIATRSARFCYPEVRIGFVPAMVAALVTRNLGEKRAFELLTTARVWTAEEVMLAGLVNTVVDDDNFETAIDELTLGISRTSASAIQLTKSLLYQVDGMSFEQALEAGALMNAIARATPDCQQGVRKFLKKD